MKTATTSLLALVIALAAINASSAQPDVEKRKAVDVQTLLEQGQASGSLPDGMVIRISACLGEPEVQVSGNPVPNQLNEAWEFASNQVHRVVCEYKPDRSIYHRVESRPFDPKGLCKDLLEGKAIEIQARKGKGPQIAFVGARYHRGSRFLEVVRYGQTILDLHETNGAVLELYRETDARAFGALYERLARQARGLFKAKADEAK